MPYNCDVEESESRAWDTSGRMLISLSPVKSPVQTASEGIAGAWDTARSPVLPLFFPASLTTLTSSLFFVP